MPAGAGEVDRIAVRGEMDPFRATYRGRHRLTRDDADAGANRDTPPEGSLLQGMLHGQAAARTALAACPGTSLGTLKTASMALSWY